jgi:hypothetical protein
MLYKWRREDVGGNGVRCQREYRSMPHMSLEDRLPRSGRFVDLCLGKVLYENPLTKREDVAAWRLEGSACVSFPQGRLCLESVIPKEQGQKANYVFWCPVEFPDGVCIEFDFHPVREPGLAMFWFCARGRNGEDIFDPSLAPRSGEYDHYRYGDINAYHAAFFRRGKPGSFQICNLRKSHGFRLVAQGGDPIPSQVYDPPYHVRVLVSDGWVQFEIDELVVYTWHDDGRVGGPPLTGGKIGFRQMAPLVAEYSGLKVRVIE